MPKLGYLLPTRERIMENHHETGSLLALAERAEALGFDSIWVGDLVTARPRHDPLTLLAAVAAPHAQGGAGHGRAAAGAAQPGAAGPSGGDARSHRRRPADPGHRHRRRHAGDPREFEAMGVPFDKRVGRMNEAMRLCKALWSGKPVDWDGLWTVKQGTVGPTPHKSGRPADLVRRRPAGEPRAHRPAL